jgi:hypothetical protein
MTQEASRRQSSRQKPAIERSLGLRFAQVQSALPAKREGPRAGQIRASSSKEIQANPNKSKENSLDFLGFLWWNRGFSMGYGESK